ncbi:lytic transglycosylase domain-containing protein [Sphingomonas sp.]|uniref:lytic transglycosylase domain-containing protein n=1 Tax=Sphingomonas sp. TaxID=28214 RepID=UPI001D6C0B17|nr:lytic transglycosylase domain-containing protein [Sphingomonas sp.]MBX9796811.1 lytic transglycosylase domain-containing protein [Sphingomonas sp.]
MIASLYKAVLLITGALGAVLTTGAAQDQLGDVRQQMKAMPADPAKINAMSAAIAEWKQLQQSDSYSFDTYARFLLAHPGWPGEAGRRRAAERALDTSSWSPGAAVSFFRRFPPLTGTGQLRYAQALLATGVTGDANAAARAAWRQGTLPPSDEAALLASFAGALSPADHDARMEALLWAGATSSAQRQLPLVSAERREGFEIRLALRTNAPGAGDLATAAAARFAGDPGFLADRAAWLKNNTRWVEARSLLAQSHAFTTRPADAESWFELLYANARAAAADAQYQTAFDIARQVDDAYAPGTDVSQRPYGERDEYTNLVWLAGRTALQTLGRPGDAMGLFERYARATVSPQSRAKGLYWAGRAALAAGRADQAGSYFDQAARFGGQFYGQLATEKLGRAMAPPPDAAARPVDPATRDAFYARETVAVARYLGTVGAYQDQTAFVRQIALDAKSDADHVLATELSRTLSRPDLGVMVGRSALQNGLADYAATGYPSVRVPEGQADRWTMIHAIARQESQFDRAAVSRAGARGLMQLMPATARQISGRLGLAYSGDALTTDTDYNIQLGSAYFDLLFNQYGSYPLAVAAYNAGGGNVNKWLAANGDPRTGQIDMIDWIEAIPFSETRNYVQRVLENAVVYDLINPQRARSQGKARLSWYLGRRPD